MGSPPPREVLCSRECDFFTPPRLKQNLPRRSAHRHQIPPIPLHSVAMAIGEQMTEDELLALVGQHIEQSVGYIGGALTQQRAQAQRYYQSQPFGDEIDGRSQYITTDVADTIEWMLPQLLEPFVAGDRVVRFNAFGPEDVESADQESDYVDWIFMNQNKGFMILYAWFKDALLSKVGVVKAWAELIQTVQNEEYEGLTEYQVMELYDDPEIEILNGSEAGFDELAGPLYNLTVKRTKDKQSIKVAVIPPEHFLISRRAITIEDAAFTAHRERQTESELILEGHDPELVRSLPAFDDDLNQEHVSRYSLDDQYPYDYDVTTTRAANREIWTTECYIRADWDGDGIAELRRVKIAGSVGSVISEGRTGTVMLVNEAWPHERPPFYSLCPQPITHKFFGMSIADMVMDIQHVRSTLVRQMLDAQYLANNPRFAVWEDMVTMDDMLVSRAGGQVRTDGPPSEAIMALPSMEPSPTTYNLLGFMTEERESRTGVNRVSQGIGADAVSDTASGQNQLMTASQTRIKLIARIFAEGGVAELFRGIHELVRKHQDVTRTIRLRNKWVEIDPSEWSERMDTTVEVGLGASNRDLQLMHLDGIAQSQAMIVQSQGGIDGPLIHARHIYNMMNKREELATYKEPNLFCGDPDDPANAPAPKPPPPPDPAILKIQADMQKAAAELKVKGELEKAKLQKAGEEAQAKMKLEYEKLVLEREEAEAKLTQDRQEHEDKMAFQYAELEAEREGHSMDVLDKQIERSRAEHDAKGKGIEASREHGESVKESTAAEAVVEQMRAENLRLQGELLEKEAEAAGATRTKRSVVERDKSNRITGVVTHEGPSTVQ